LLATVFARTAASHPVRLLAMVGFLGGYTTFSTFAFETRRLFDSGQSAASAGYSAASLLGGFAAATLGILVGRGLGYNDGAYPQRVGAGAAAGTSASAETD
jgi:CrcB protein